jgi:hypothetical protein
MKSCGNALAIYDSVRRPSSRASNVVLKRLGGKSAMKASKTDVVITKNALVLNIDDELRRQIADCVKRSGKATFTIKEVGATRVPHMASVEVISD